MPQIGEQHVSTEDYVKALRPDEIIRTSDFYQPWPHQEAFHSSMARFRLQVGGFGSGKSRPLLMEAIFCAIEFPGSNSIILRKTIPDLKRTVIDKFKSDIPKAMYEKGSQELGTYNESDHIVYWPPDLVPEYTWVDGHLKPVMDHSTGKQKMVWRQSKIYFGACEREGDIGKYLSTEFVFVGFEELGEFPFIIWDMMENRCRSTLPIPGVRTSMGGATNPMGVGWGWISRLFVKHLPLRGMDESKYDPNQYEYFHSTVDDNPILRHDADYVAGLEKSPLRDRIRWGKLDVKTGQYFDNWQEEIHAGYTRANFVFDEWQPVWIGWDYGFGHFAVLTFWTKAYLKVPNLPTRLVNVTIAELVLHEKTPEEQCEALLAKIPRTYDKETGEEIGMQWSVSSIHLSWERFNKTTKDKHGNVISVADQIGDILSSHGLPRPSRSNTERVSGWTKMYSLLEMNEWYVLKETCPTVVDSIPLLVRGDGITVSAEDVIKPAGLSLEDDCGDSLRYAVAGVLLEDEGQKPKEQVMKEKYEAIKDPVARFAEQYKDYNKAQADMRRGPKQIIVPSWVNKVRGDRK